jgi:predicted amidohydrolase YtcJ
MATKFYGGKIYLGKDSFVDKAYVSDEGELIEELSFYNSDEQREVNLNGSLVLPAFRDGHAHPLFAGREAKGLDISECKNQKELLHAIASYQQSNPETTWIDGAVFDRSMPATFTRQVLDSAAASIPVVLHGDDHHTLWVNTEALEVAGIISSGKLSNDTAGIDVDEQGSPTGILREWPAMRLVMDKAPEETLESDVANLIYADKKLAASGIIECYDAWIDRGMAETYIAAADRRLLDIDYKLCFRADPDTFFDDLSYIESMRTEVNRRPGLDGNAIKFFIDGIFGSGTALVEEPYLSTGSHGTPVWDEIELRKAIKTANNESFQIHIHAIGDAGTALAISILEELPKDELKYRPVLIHAELTNANLLNRMKDLNAIACVQPYWAQLNGLLESCLQHLGEERLSKLYAFKEMLNVGVSVAFSSDWPVSSFDPLKGLSVAVNRRERPSQEVHNPSQQISVVEAISAYTTGVQAMRSKPNELFFELGSDFDAIVLDKDIFTLPTMDIYNARVTATFKAGRRIF